MNFKRLFGNRSLRKIERNSQIFQQDISPTFPLHQASVIRMNSTYLECVDMDYMERGTKSFLGFGFIFIFVSLILSLLIATVWKWSVWSPTMRKDSLDALLLIICGSIVAILICFLTLKTECFTYTHYPIRFNRKTRKVHAFCRNGTVMTGDWEDLFFNINFGTSLSNKGVYFHMLAADGKTVLGTFKLPHVSTRSDPLLLSFWEFVRLYMEGNDKSLEALASQIDGVSDIAEKPETFKQSLKQCAYTAYDAYSSDTRYFLSQPLVYWYGFFRWLGQLTNKIPRWPADIEAQCRIEPDDPYLRDCDHLAPRWKPSKQVLDMIWRARSGVG